MLVLQRKPGQRIIINDGEIAITIVKIRGEQVTVSIEAPRDVRIDREEIYKRRENGTQER